MEILQLTSDKAEFSNFLNDTLILPENSKVCLNKASFSIPFIVSRNIEFPFEGAAPDYTKTFFKVAINGVENDISYQEFYNAYNVLDTLQTVSIDELYNGIFPCFVDNLSTYISDAGTSYEIPSFMEVVAQACDVSFDYYKFSSDIITEQTDLGIDFFNTSFTVNGINIVQIKNFRRIKSFGLIAQYYPQKVTQTTITNYSFTAGNIQGWTRPSDHNLTSSGGPDMALATMDIDPNGGYVSCKPTYGAGNLAWGISLIGKGAGNHKFSVSANYDETLIDVGFTYSNNGTHNVFQIIDGNQKFVYNHGAGETVSILPNYKPTTNSLRFNSATDYFYLLFRKGRTMNGTTEFTISIFQGNDDIDDSDNTKLIYVAKRTLNSSEIRPQVLAFSNGAGNVLDDWGYIVKTTDSEYEDDYQQLINTGNLDGITSANSLILTPVLNPGTWEYEREFWDKMGISQDQGTFNAKTEFRDDGWNKSIKWDLPENIKKFYWIGKKYISQILDLSTNPNYISFNRGIDSFIEDIPREISISLMDSTINPKAGNYVKTTSNNISAIYNTGTFNKVVNHIQTDKEDLDLIDNTTIDYVYEAFNLVYRKMENRQPIPMTQIKVKLAYKNFQTDNEQNIDNLDGTCKLELLFDKD